MRSPTPPVVNILTGIGIYSTWSTLSGLCCGEGVVYILEPQNDNSLLTYVYEDISGKNQAIVPVDNPNGMGVYRGSLYIYSQSDKAVYRLESPSKTSVYSITELKANSDPIHYGLNGRMIESSAPGIHILKYPDGKVNKIVVR